jgi:hypothetical protein
VKHDFESLTIFNSEFDLEEVLPGFEGASIPECGNTQKRRHSMVLASGR